MSAKEHKLLCIYTHTCIEKYCRCFMLIKLNLYMLLQKLIARDPAEIERSNLVNICKLVVKELLEQSVRYGRMLDSDHLPLQHFFIVIEHVLGHGLRTKKVCRRKIKCSAIIIT